MQRIKILVLAATLFTVSAPATAGTGNLEITGSLNGTVKETSAELLYMERVKIWMLQLRSPVDHKKEHGTGFMANLFFSREFDPHPGTYTIRFSYLSKVDTLGASLVVSGEGKGMFSHNTEGAASFGEFGEKVTGKFEFTSYDGSKEDRRKVTVKGTFSLPRGDALK